MDLKRARQAIPPSVALAAWGLVVWACYGTAGIDGDEYIAGILAVVASGWALLDYYYRRSARERQEAHAGHDVGVLAEGVAAYMRQAGPGASQSRASGGRRSPRPAPGPPGATSAHTPPSAPQ